MEAYVSQYLDHHVTQDNGTIVVSSRQNQPQSGKFPVVEHEVSNPCGVIQQMGINFWQNIQGD